MCINSRWYINAEAIQRAGDAAATNFNPFNTSINTVRGQESGYATWNPLSLRLNQGTLTDGNLHSVLVVPITLKQNQILMHQELTTTLN